MNKHPDSELLLEYASGNLSPAPIVAVTTHLHYCETCRDLVAAMQEVGGTLLGELGEQKQASIETIDNLLEQVMSAIDKSDADNGQQGSDGATSVGKMQRPRAAQTHDDDDELLAKLPRFIMRFVPEDRLRWQNRFPSLWRIPLSVGDDSHETTLFRINAGDKTPVHSHKGQELSLVLSGSFSDQHGISYQQGDFLVRPAGEEHCAYAAPNEDCICLNVLVKEAA